MLTLRVSLIILVIFCLTAVSSSATAKEISQEKSSNSAHIEILKEQNKMLKGHNEQLLNVVLWSLGFAALFLFVFLGVNWLSAYRFHEKDKENIRIGLSSLVRDLIEKESKTKSTSLDEKFNGKMVALEQWKSQVEASSEKKLGDLQNKLALSISQLKSGCDGSINDLAYGVAELQVEVYEMQAERWVERSMPIFDNALTNYIRMLEIVAKYNLGSWRFSGILDKILSSVKAIEKIDVAAAAELMAVLPNVPKNHQTIIDEIKKAIRH